MADLASLGLAIDSRPAVEAATALGKLQQAAGGAESAAQTLQATATRAGTALGQATTGARQAATAHQDLATQITAAGTSLGGFVTRQAETTRAVNDATAAIARQAAGWRAMSEAGKAAVQQYDLVARANARLGSLSSTGAVPTAAAGAQARTQGLRPDELRNLTYQAGDIVSSAASGMSPAMILMQQGPQIAQMFGPGGASITGMFKSAGDAAGALAARIGIVGGAFGLVTTAAVAAVAAQQSYASSQDELSRSLSGVGRASGATAAQINDMASAGASAVGISTREYRELAGVYASTGKIGREMYDGLARTARDLAKATGQDLAEAGQMQAQAFADPARGADILNEKLGFLNDRTRESIQRLQAQGDRLGAQRVLLDAYSAGLARASDATSGWAKITQTAGNAISNAWDAVGQRVDRFLTGGGLEQQLADAQKWVEAARAQSQGILGTLAPGRTAAELREAEANLMRLQSLVDRRDRGLEQASANQNSRVIGDLVRSLDPASQELKRVQDQAEQLRKAISDPVKWGLDRTQLAETEAAFERISRLAKTMAEDVANFGSSAAAAMVRASEFNNRTVNWSPVARNVADRQRQFEEQLREKGIDPNGPPSAAVTADYDGRIANADSRELASLRAAREAALQNATEREALARSLQLDTDTIKQETIRRGQLGQTRYSTSIDQVPAQYRDAIFNAAAKRGEDPNFIASILRQESGFNPNAVSRAGAQGIAQFMPDTARGMELANPFDPFASIEKMVEHVADLRRKYGSDELVLSGYNRGEPRTDKWIKGGRDVATMPQETRDYIAKITTRAPGTEDQIRVERDRTAALETQKRAVQDNTELYGRDAVALEARRIADEQLQRAVLSGVNVTEEYRQAILSGARATAEASRALAATRLGRDLEFEREQLGRTDSEQSAYSRARSAFGDTSSPLAQAAIDTMAVNDNLRAAKDLAKDAFGGIAGDLRRGATAAEALQNVMNRIIDKLMNAGFDKLVSGMFGGGGGIFGSLFGGGGGGAAAISDIGTTAGPGAWFASGGYTGAGAKYEPAGVVHRGEYVFDAASTSRIGVATLESIRSGLRGYADGGLVTGYAPPPATAPGTVVQGGPSFTATIVTQGSAGDPEADQRAAEMNAKAMRQEFDRMWAANAQREMSPGGMLYAAGARRSR